MSIKALAAAVLQRNLQGNQQETKSFLGGKLRQPEWQPGKLSGEVTSSDLRGSATLFQKQEEFCAAHGELNEWSGSCPCSLDDCLFSRVLDAAGDIEKLRGVEIGQGVTTDQVIDDWLELGEQLSVLFDKPAWLICMAESLRLL